MLRICVLSIAFVLGATSTPASADDAYQPKIVPPCKMYRTIGGVDVCGYDSLDDWKQVLVVDLDLSHALTQLKNERAKSASLAELRDLAVAELDEMAKSRQALQAHSDKLTADLIDLDKKYQDERVKPRTSAIAWTIAAVSTSVLVGFVVHEVLR